MTKNIEGAACAMVLFLMVLARGAAMSEEPDRADWLATDVVQTNYYTRMVTNMIEVRVPTNVFVTEYRTNAVEFYRTNWVTSTLTNHTTVTLTNWETVVVLKTNWIKQSVVKVIEVNTPPNVALPVSEEPGPSSSSSSRPELSALDSQPETLVIEAVRTSVPADGTAAEVSFKVRSSSNPEARLQVQQWRVERDDRTVLISSQAQEFKRVVPLGRYHVQVRVRREVDGPTLTSQGGLIVMKDAVIRK